MRKCRHWIPALFPVSLMFLTLIVDAQTRPAAQKPLSAMSEKELFKKANSDLEAGNLDGAREAIMLVITKKKKPDKKYEAFLASVHTKLADREVTKGEAACDKLDLAACQNQIAAAKVFATTDRVKQLESKFDRQLSELRRQYDAALKLADSDPEESLVKLNGLTRFGKYLLNLNSETARVTRLLVEKLLVEGARLTDERNWDLAALRFERVLTLANGNEAAIAGLKKIERGRQGYQFYTEAMNRFTAGNYRAALKSVASGIDVYPEAQDFRQARTQIVQGWVNKMLGDLPTLLANTNDLRSTREAYLLLEQIRALDSGNPEIPKYSQTVGQNFGANCLLKAAELEAIVDYSRIATAVVLKLDAQRLMPAETVKPEELKTVAVAFNRKRKSQLLLSVDNLSAAPASFTQAVEVRSRNKLENLALPDLRIRTPEDYQKMPNEDPQFQDLRPDGKSATAQLTISIARHESERQSSEKPVEMQSEYVSGKEMVPNPDYAALQEELSRIRRALDNPHRKKDKATTEGWTELAFQQKQLELAKVDRMLPRDKITKYTYQKIEHKQHSIVELSITMRDYLTRDVVASDNVSFHNEREAIQIDGVKEGDTHGLQNQPVRLPSPEQVLREAERTVLESLDKKIIELLPAFTNRFFNEGEKALKAGRIDDAVESFICHWVFFRGRLDSAQSEHVVEVVKRETGFDLVRDGANLLSMAAIAP